MTEQEEPLHIEQMFESEKIEHHEIEQRGLDLVCVSCVTPHAQVRFFKPGQILSQNTDGEYVILGTQEEAETRSR